MKIIMEATKLYKILYCNFNKIKGAALTNAKYIANDNWKYSGTKMLEDAMDFNGFTLNRSLTAAR